MGHPLIQFHRPVPIPSYQELLGENARLKAALESQTLSPQHTVNYNRGEVLNITESFERDLFAAVGDSGRTSTIFGSDAIRWPSPESVKTLLIYGKVWTSWIHCALHHPTFELECIAFLAASDGSAAQRPAWLAVYFSYMAVGLFPFNCNCVEAY